jgi:hypothetical protein
MWKRFGDERGIALVTSLLVTMVLVSIGVTVVGLSIHNAGQSSLDRKRIQAVNTAEAGLDATLSAMQYSITSGLPCGANSVSATLPTTPASEYHVTVQYYTSYPPTGTAMTCPLSDATRPAGAIVTSAGTAVVSGSSISVTRTMQTQVRLTASRGAFGQAIFSDKDLTLQNNLTVNGFQAYDGNLYTNGNLNCGNGSLINGSVYVQGTATLSNSCNIVQDVWAGGSVSMSNSATVGHDVTASASGSDISLDNSSTIAHNATAGGQCTGCGSNVGGDVVRNHTSPLPPVYTLPTLNYSSSAWQAAGFDTTKNYSDCTAARTAILAGYTARTVARISPACALSFGNNDVVNVRNDMAIVTDGSISSSNQVNFQSADGNPYTLYLIVPTSAASGGCTGGTHDMSYSNQTNFTNLRVFAFTPCTVIYSNNNDGLGGQIIGGQVTIQNLYTLAFLPIDVPGGTDTGYSVDIAFIREIVNS